MPSQHKNRFIIILILILNALIFSFDLHAPLGMASCLLYGIPLILSFWLPLNPLIYFNTIVIDILILLGIYLSPSDSAFGIAVFNRGLGIAVSWLMTLFIFKFKSMSQELKKKNLAFFKLIDENPEGVIVVNKEGIVRFVNSTLKNISGRKAKELVGEMFGIPVAMGRAAEVDVVFDDGRQGIAEMHAVKSIWQEEDAYLIYLHDVTEVKEAEKRLKTNETRYRSYIELTDQLAWVTNANGEVEEDIPSWRRFTGQGEDEIKGSGWSRAVHPDDMDHALDVWKRAAETKSAFGAEYRVRRHDGEYRHFMVRGVPVLNEDGNIVEWFKTCIDISERKKSEEETKKSAEIKTKFTSIISHELRTPLTAIKEGISIVLDGSTGGINDEQKDFLDTAKRNVDRLTRLINDVLDFQKMEAGRARFNLQRNDIGEVISYVESTMEPLAAKKGLEIFVETEDNLPNIQCDKDKIIQVLMNLINNSLKFTDKGNITITAKRIDGVIDVAVKDTGPGIKNQDLPRLFKPFEQLETTRDKRAGGSGLGLSICKEIIDMHKGKIYAESEFGKGSTFHFLLPIQVEQRQVV